jgi:hypothetical protein
MARNRHIPVLLLLALFFFSPLTAQEWWEKESYTQWSTKQVYKILYDSPWVSFTSAGFRPVQVPWYGAGSGGRGTRTIFYRSFYRISLLTAQPMREALLRLYSFSSLLVDAGSLNADAKSQKEQSRLEKFIESTPNDVRVQGDEQYIILGLTGVVSTQKTTQERTPRMSPANWQEESHVDELSKVDVSELLKSTSLATNTGKRAMLSRYEPPGADRLGAKFYFPRTLPDGTPLLRAGDKELVFEAQINKTRIKGKFDLGKMVSRGKLEI